MVFEEYRKASKKGNRQNDFRSRNVGGSISVALKPLSGKPPQSQYKDFDEEPLDFEPDLDESDTTQNCLQLNDSQCDFFLDESPEKVLNLNSEQHVHSPVSTTCDNVSVSNISIAHRKDILPILKSDAQDGREYEYLPFYYTPSCSAKTLDSSSDDSISDDETESNGNTHIQNNSDNQLSQQSNGSDSEDNSTDLDMTKEEEDKLLYGSEDYEEPEDIPSSPDNQLRIQKNLVETCQIGSARITLPKFVTGTKSVVSQSNELKRSKSTAKLRFGQATTKKKKWDLKFTPDGSFTRIFLEDIGYVPDWEMVDKVQKTVETPEMLKKLIVICNEDSGSVDKLGGTQREIISIPKKVDTFKLPLPPPKRPPTRPKRTVCNTNTSSINLQIKFSNKEEEPDLPKSNMFIVPKATNRNQFNSRDDFVTNEDDTISIIASTIGCEQPEETCRTDLQHKVEDTRSMEPTPFSILDYTQNRVQEWIQNVPPHGTQNDNLSYEMSVKSDTIHTPSHSLTPADSLLSPSQPTGHARINFKEIPRLLQGLCYYHFFYSSCLKPHCNRFHDISNNNYTWKFKNSNPDEVSVAFQFSMKHEKLLKEMLPSFIAAFAHHKLQNELITCAKQLLKIAGNDNVTEDIVSVVRALEETGLTMLEAVEMISFNIGFLEHPVLADILLDVSTRQFNVQENWQVVKRICKARGKILPSIAQRILTRAMSVYPPNKELCLDIYNVIVTNKITELSEINEEVLAPYKALLGFRDNITTLPKSSNITPFNSQVVPTASRSSTNASPWSPRETLLMHINNNLIKERQRFEKEVETTNVQAPSDITMALDLEHLNYRKQRSNWDELTRCSSGSDERYFIPTDSPKGCVSEKDGSVLSSGSTVQSMFGKKVENSKSSSECRDVDTLLNFEPPPSIISEYVPQVVSRPDVGNSVIEDKPTLMPSRPIFGRPLYRKDFSFESSLHNLLPKSLEHVCINERDVGQLNSVIKSSDGPEFYKLLQCYAGPATIENFITMTVVHLKSCKDVYKTLVDLVKSLEFVKPDYASDTQIKAVIEVVLMNLLFDLEKKGRWNIANKLLQVFCDWDSLISSKLFQIFTHRQVSTMGRYIFLAKLLVQAKNFYLTYEVLMCPSLNLLESPASWPHYCNAMVDLNNRNFVLKEFFEHGYRYYIIGVTDMYRRIFKYGQIKEYDGTKHFNPTLISIMNEQQMSLLKYFHADIDVYYKEMDKNVLRAFTLILVDKLDQENMFKLYELCCERQIYTLFTGSESTIIVRNNMLDVELQLILNYYFYKISETRRYPHTDVLVLIKLMERNIFYPKLLQKCIRSIKEIYDRVREILSDSFNITAQSLPGQFTIVSIPNEQILKWMQCKQRWFYVQR